MLHTHLVEHVGGQAHHGKVVNYEDDPQVNRLPVSHEPRAEPHHAEIEEEDEGHGDGGVDQQPRVRPFIWAMTNSDMVTHTDALLQPFCEFKPASASKKSIFVTVAPLYAVGGWSPFLL